MQNKKNGLLVIRLLNKNFWQTIPNFPGIVVYPQGHKMYSTKYLGHGHS